MLNLSVGDVIFKKFRITDGPITSGNTSIVWKVHHIEWNVDMALKIPKDEYYKSNKEMFDDECLKWVNLGMHNNVAACYFILKMNDTPCIFCEWCGGGNLKDKIDNGSLYKGTDDEQLERILYIALECLYALQHLQSDMDFSHNDIKPANILFDESGSVKLTDFGSAGNQGSYATTAYMSPEQFEIREGTRSAKVGEETDTYSWALIVLEMFIGKRVWDNGAYVSRDKEMVFNCQKRVEIPNKLKDILYECLSEEPEDRPVMFDVIIDVIRVYDFYIPGNGDQNAFFYYTPQRQLSADIFNNIGVSYLSLGYANYAMGAWKTALAYYPAHHNARVNLETIRESCFSIIAIDNQDEDITYFNNDNWEPLLSKLPTGKTMKECYNSCVYDLNSLDYSTDYSQAVESLNSLSDNPYIRIRHSSMVFYYNNISRNSHLEKFWEYCRKSNIRIGTLVFRKVFDTLFNAADESRIILSRDMHYAVLLYKNMFERTYNAAVYSFINNRIIEELQEIYDFKFVDENSFLVSHIEFDNYEDIVLSYSEYKINSEIGTYLEWIYDDSDDPMPDKNYNYEPTDADIPKELHEISKDYNTFIYCKSNDKVIAITKENVFCIYDIDYTLTLNDDQINNETSSTSEEADHHPLTDEEIAEFEKIFSDMDESEIVNPEVYLDTQEEIIDAPEDNDDIVSFDASAVKKYLKYRDRDKHDVSEIPCIYKSVDDLKRKLLDRVIGQDNVVRKVCDGLRGVMIDSNDTKGPITTFTFAGPPGVGKTLLANSLAELIGLEFMAFDMSEYARREDMLNLIGSDSKYKASAPGRLTDFVLKHPRCILLFDEIEKAAPDIIRLFYQILDQGRLTDQYWSSAVVAKNNGMMERNIYIPPKIMKSEGVVSFKDTIIIFTTNVGRKLYKDDSRYNLSAVSERTLLNALENEKNEETGVKFFPSAFVSRIAKGTPLIFNNLCAKDLISIADKTFTKVEKKLSEKYGINITHNDKVISAIMYSIGGGTDARALTSSVGKFVTSKISDIINDLAISGADIMREFEFTVNDEDIAQSMRHLFYPQRKRKVLICSSEPSKYSHLNGNSLDFIYTNSFESALEKLSENDNISAVFININLKEFKYNEEMTYASSMFARKYSDGMELFTNIRNKMPEMPVYLFEEYEPYHDKVVDGFINAGARGVVKAPKRSEDIYEYKKTIISICDLAYIQEKTDDLARRNKILKFDTVNKGNRIVLRNFQEISTPDAEDSDLLINESEIPNVRFENIIGAQKAKDILMRISKMIKTPEKYSLQGETLPKGILLYGPPGTGKTMLAKALASESNVSFISKTGSDFISNGINEIKRVFERARRNAPAVIFIDEVDAIAAARVSTHSSVENHLLLSLLTQLDGFKTDTKHPVVTVCATNFGLEDGESKFGTLDEAFVRRFTHKIKVDKLGVEDIKELIRRFICGLSDESLNNLAAQMKALELDTAEISTILDNARNESDGNATEKNVYQTMLEHKFGKALPQTPQMTHRTAVHEAGHAVVSFFTGHEVSHITIESRGNFGGFTLTDAVGCTKKDMLDSISIALGGRAAEMVSFEGAEGQSTGAADDIDRAGRMAYSMIKLFGMDDEWGLIALDIYQPPKEKLDEILNKQLKNAVSIIKDHKDQFERLVLCLEGEKYLNASRIEKILTSSDLNVPLYNDYETDAEDD